MRGNLTYFFFIESWAPMWGWEISRVVYGKRKVMKKLCFLNYFVGKNSNCTKCREPCMPLSINKVVVHTNT